MTRTPNQLIKQLPTILVGDDSTPPPEVQIIAAAISALPDSDYLLYDLEVVEAPAGLLALPCTPIAKWDGTQESSYGYGCVELVTTRVGNGLSIAFGGSQGQSASVLYVVPAQLEGWLA